MEHISKVSNILDERIAIYKRIVSAIKNGPVRVIVTEVNGYDEEHSSIYSYEPKHNKYICRDCDGYYSGLMTEDNVMGGLLDCELQHYTIVQVDREPDFMEWEDHEEMNKTDVPLFVEMDIPKEIFIANGSEHLLGHDEIIERPSLKSSCEFVKTGRYIEYKNATKVKLFPADKIRINL